ncbi:MAG: hypothetical protein J7598_09500 [Mitsuaria chitosanitabida]|uniref:hypothetical protein n=1 Tax=Roseateles chitosanitabidus TaxID=65048 RepID=UPI001B06CCCE|nr:hypothetical protein [Roseateles chitosanitabidus]MBO9686835.1 hypothetical protein [Roseateles chitosanitabidus]
MKRMLDSLFRSSIPKQAVEYAGFVLVHCAAIADSNRDGELICPFAVLTEADGRRVIDFESDTQQEAVEKGWASLVEARSSRVWWAFGREGLYRTPDGKGTDVLTVSVWLPGMDHHYSLIQCFSRGSDQSLYFIGEPQLLKHRTDQAEPVARWDHSALARGIASHPKGSRWSEWRPQ